MGSRFLGHESEYRQQEHTNLCIDKGTRFFYHSRAQGRNKSVNTAKGDAVTKADIVNQIADATGLTKTDTAVVVDGMFASLIDAMHRGENIEIRGFGTFKIVHRAPRTGRNPKTGEVVKIPSRAMPVFKPSRELRNSIEVSVLPSS